MVIELWILIWILILGAIVWGVLLWRDAHKWDTKWHGRENNNIIWSTSTSLWLLDELRAQWVLQSTAWSISLRVDPTMIVHPHVRIVATLLSQTIIGQPMFVVLMLLGLCSGKHVLIQSVPGLAKTTAVKTLATLTKLSLGRIQWTPDLLPSDITGYERMLPDGSSIFQPWPLFHQLILCDEINRTTPKVQSALIQAMQEWQVTVWTNTYDLPQPFLVFATANPTGSKWVYTLPEAQLDRFWLCIYVDYPDNEQSIVGSKTMRDALNQDCIIDLISRKQAIDDIHIDDNLIHYITTIIQTTRTLPWVSIGCSPRAGQDLVVLAKTWSWLQGKTQVTYSDIDCLIQPVLWHRIVRK